MCFGLPKLIEQTIQTFSDEYTTSTLHTASVKHHAVIKQIDCHQSVTTSRTTQQITATETLSRQALLLDNCISEEYSGNETKIAIPAVSSDGSVKIRIKESGNIKSFSVTIEHGTDQGHLQSVICFHFSFGYLHLVHLSLFWKSSWLMHVDF